MTRNAAIAPSELAMDESVVWVIMGLLVGSVTGFQTLKFDTHLGGSKWLDKGTTLGTPTLHTQSSLCLSGHIWPFQPLFGLQYSTRNAPYWSDTWIHRILQRRTVRLKLAQLHS